MRSVPFRRSRLLAPLSFAAALAIVWTGAAQAQPDVTRVVKPAAKPVSPSAMAPYEKSVSPAKAAQSQGVGSDPLEPLNRKIFLFNGALDIVLIRPLAVFWHHAAPKPIRQGINNFLSNLGEPVVFINDVLQGHPATAAGTATRFTVNTVVGLLGVIDVTGSTGLPHHDNGFGLTLGRWGVKAGPYLMIPLLGPSTLRDGVGQAVDLAANPLTYARNTGDGGLTTGLTIIGGLDARADADPDLKALQAMSTDVYAALRSFYLQNRQAQITGGKIDLNALPDFDDPGATPAAAATPAPRAAAPSIDLTATPADPAPPAAAAPATAPSAPGVEAESGAQASPDPATTSAPAGPVADPAPPPPADPSDATPPPPAAPKGV